MSNEWIIWSSLRGSLQTRVLASFSVVWDTFEWSIRKWKGCQKSVVYMNVENRSVLVCMPWILKYNIVKVEVIKTNHCMLLNLDYEVLQWYFLGHTPLVMWKHICDEIYSMCSRCTFILNLIKSVIYSRNLMVWMWLVQDFVH